MKIEGYQLEKTDTNCPYLENRIFTSNNLILNSFDEEGLETLLSKGYRHFGEYFYRPECNRCTECHPIRIPVKLFNFSRSEKRVITKNAHFTVIIIDKPVADKSYFNLYKDHKKRFKEKDVETYDNWISSFFSKFDSNKLMEIKDGDILVGVTHLDVTSSIVSAVYCYWNEKYAFYSPGKFSILKGIQYAIETGAEYYYLGYYIKDNKHMSYKANYRPNQILEGGAWK
ncbi:MAG: arginyltransferase [Spirochaetales bacterium]|nr:arginyltransferase [Spirochaetales bacterium]